MQPDSPNITDADLATRRALRTTALEWCRPKYIIIELSGNEEITPHHIAALDDLLKESDGVGLNDIQNISICSDLNADSAKALADMILKCPNLIELSFYEVTLDTNAEPLWDGIRAHKNLSTLTFDKCPFPDAEHNAASPIRNLPNLTRLSIVPSDTPDATLEGLGPAIAQSSIHDFSLQSLRSFLIEPQTLTPILQGLEKVPRLDYFELSPLPHTPEVTGALLDMVEAQRHLCEIHIINSDLTETELQQLTGRLADHPRMATLKLGKHDFPPEAQIAFAQTVLQSCPDITDIDCYDSLRSHNMRGEQLPFSPDTYPGLKCFGPFSHDNVVQFKRNYEAISNLQGSIKRLGQDWTHYDQSFLYDTYNHVNGIFTEFTLRNARDGFDAFLATLPGLPSQPQDWLKANKTGFSPVDNPRIWRDPGLGDTLAQVDFTPDFLDTPSAKGMTFRMGAALGLSGKKFVELMNGHGLRIGAAELLDERGKPSNLFQEMIDAGKAPALFAPNNLHGAQPGEIRKLFSCLPQDQQRRADTHQYRALLNRSAPAQTTNAARGR